MPKVKWTDEERTARLDEQRQRRNERRRAQYRGDTDHRREVQKRSREQYQTRVGTQLFDCRANLGRLAELGTVRTMKDGSVRLTFTNAELGDTLGHDRQIVYRWQHRGQIPEPVYLAEVATGGFGRDDTLVEQAVYTEQEVKAIVTAFGQHKAQYVQFRMSHRDTIRRIAEAVYAVRDTLTLEAAP